MIVSTREPKKSRVGSVIKLGSILLVRVAREDDVSGARVTDVNCQINWQDTDSVAVTASALCRTVD